jgi:purine nucleosidase
MKKMIIDCDPGIDDALALWLAAGSALLDIVAVTTVAGNRPVATTSANARKLMDLAGHAAVPVYAGAARPLGHASARCNLVHGEDGLGGVAVGAARPLHAGHAATRLVELLGDSEAGSLTLVATGPLTNLALAETLSPGILARAAQVVVMGGALRVPGNITSAAEFNFYADPVAASMVMAAGAALVLFPLDVTGAAIMDADWIASFGAIDSACGRAAGAMLAAYAAFDPLLHDACPVAYLIEPGLFAGKRCQVDVDWRPGPTEGHCLASYDGAATNVLAIDSVALAPLLALVRKAIGTLP